MSAHTPGPWYVGEIYANTIAVKGQTSGMVVAKAAAMPSKIKEAEANAALIASAPDLLAERDALRSVLREILAIERKSYRNTDDTSVVHMPAALVERAEKLLGEV